MRSPEVLPLPYRAVNGGVGIASGAVWAIGAIAFVANGATDPGLFVVGAMAGLVSALFVFLGVRTLRCELVLSVDGVLIRNHLRTYWVLWSDVDAVLLPYQGVNGATVRLLLHDGSTVACRAATPGSRTTRSGTEQAKSYRRKLQQRLSEAQRRLSK